MEGNEADIIEFVLRSELGNSAQVNEWDYRDDSPMSFVLEEIRKELGDIFSVYWVEGGHPEVFCLDGFSRILVVFNAQYLALSLHISELYRSKVYQDVVSKPAERVAFQLISEMALRKGDPDFAVSCFLKKMSIDPGNAPGNRIQDKDIKRLLSAPVNETYMASLFYGLLHELGHFSPLQKRDFQYPGYSDEWMLGIVKELLEQYDFPADIKQEALRSATNKDSGSVIEITHLRSEAIADVFACSALFRTTRNLMKKAGKKKFSLSDFLLETIVFHNVISFFGNCRRIALSQLTEESNYEKLLEELLQPLAMTTRRAAQHTYLKRILATLSYGPDYNKQQSEKINEEINEIYHFLKERETNIEQGLSAARTYLYNPERQECVWVLLEKLRQQLIAGNAQSKNDTARFCHSALSLGKQGKLLSALLAVLKNSGMAFKSLELAERIFFVFWEQGPDFNYPIGIDTKYGYLILVFTEQTEYLDHFLEIFSNLVAEEATVYKAILPLTDTNALEAELKDAMPDDEPFIVAVEGTELFLQYIEELSEGSIWE